MLLPLLFFAGLAAAQPDCAALVESARPAIERANGDWIRALKARDAAATAAAYAEDGLFVLPDGAVVKGRAAVQTLYAASSKSAASITGGGIDSQGTACGDGLVYEWGVGVLRTRGPDGVEHERGGPYLTVWKRVGGEWKIIRNLAF